MMPDHVSKERLKVLDQQLRWLAQTTRGVSISQLVAAVVTRVREPSAAGVTARWSHRTIVKPVGAVGAPGGGPVIGHVMPSISGRAVVFVQGARPP
jgi:hypothetical protein